MRRLPPTLLPFFLTACIFGSPDRETVVERYLEEQSIDALDLLNCGTFDIPRDCANERIPDPARCMLDAWTTCIPATARFDDFTVEGAPLVNVSIIHPSAGDCTAAWFFDDSEDELAEDAGVDQSACTDLDFGSVNACIPLIGECTLIDSW